MLSSYSDIIRLIPKHKLKSFHQVSAYRGVAQVILEWTIIIAAAVFCESYFSWPLYILVWALIGGRLLGLGILMHDATHGSLHPNKKVNDFFGDVLCSWPLFISLRTYRAKHLAHHKWLNSDKDPDFIGKVDDNWSFPISRWRLFRIMIVQLLGLGVIDTFRVMYKNPVVEKKQPAPLWYTLTRIGFYLLVIGALVSLGLWKQMFLYWIIPFLTWTQFANKLRRLAEHSAVKGRNPDFQTRTTIHGLISRIFLAPNQIAYHNEHHILPGIPSYHLPAVYQEIQKHEEAREALHVSHSYREVLKEMVLD